MDLTTPWESPDGSRTMKLAYFSNKFPHDDLNGLCRQLHNYSKDRRHPVLARFIDEATLAVREEVHLLPASLKASFPPFQTIWNLADHAELHKGPLGGAIDGILLCATQLAIFIGHHEIYPGAFDYNSVDTCLSGISMGLLATAAVSVSPTLADIPLAGAEVIRVAFRFGILVDEVSQNLEPRDPHTGQWESWAYVLPDVTEDVVQKELDEIHKQERVPDTGKIYISALSQTSTTISGPPSRLKSIFRDTTFFRDRKYIPLPVYGGLCHAPHIFNQHHVDTIVGTRSMNTLNSKHSPRIPVLSTSTGLPLKAKTTLDLFKCIVWEVLVEQIKWDSVIEGMLERASNIAASECQVFASHKSPPTNDLLAAMNSKFPHLGTKTEELLPWTTEKNTEARAPRGSAQSKLAIVGMSCRLPGGATDTEKFWDLLEKGLDVHRKIPADRFDVDTHVDPTGKKMNCSQTAYGCFIDEPGLFDAPFFNMSPREAQQTDPMQRLALVTAYEALERSGYVANRSAASNQHRVGTFYGQASDDYREVNAGQEVSTYFIPGGCRGFGPGRINYFFKFSGPSYSIDTACSSSMATIQTACSSLWNGDTDTVVAGGMNILTNCDVFAGLSNGHFLSKTPNACKTWDAQADGYVRADGIGSIVMKRLEDAEADNDNILGIIHGAGTNHSAEAVSITHPHAGAQSYLSRQVLSSAGINPFDVSYVELHGTGTQAGDATEMKSVTDVFAPSSRGRNPKQPLHIGSVKANVGHGEAVAGVTALIKVLLMFQKEAIPPHVGIKSGINPALPKDLDKRNVQIAFKQQSWPRVPEKKRIAFVNNFGASGGNSALVIEEGPTREITDADPRSTHVVTVSAKSKVSLKGNLERLIKYLDVNESVSLPSVSYTTTARRYHYNHRVAIPTSDVGQLKKSLASSLKSVDSHKPVPSTGAPPIAFAFTGQGASYKSMNLELFHDSPVFRSQILHLDTLAKGQGFSSFVPAINGSYPQDHAHSAVITQLALVCTEIALAKYWESLGVKPDVVVGHSMGEYAALHVAGVLSASDVIFLVGQRAQLLEAKCKSGTHKMLAVRAPLADIAECAENNQYEIACINGPKETVLSGAAEQIDKLCEVLQKSGIKCSALDVAFAFHSAQTDPILKEFEEIGTTGALFQAPKLPYISPLLGKVVFDDKTINATYLRRATREPVNFLNALKSAEKVSTIDDSTVWVEIGPHPVCMSFVKATLPSSKVTIPTIRRGEDNWKTLASSTSSLHCTGVDIDWNEFHQPFEKALRLLDLPTYSWNEKNYWLQYNGDWSLTKGNTFYDAEKGLATTRAAPAAQSGLTTSVQQIIEESFQGTAGKVVMQSDLMQPDLFAAAWGHQMNGCGVVTSSINADIVYTLAEYLYKKLVPKAKHVDINVANLDVLKGLVAQKHTKTPQLLQVSAETADIRSGVVDLVWRNVLSNGEPDEEPFASANVYYGNASEWLQSWVPTAHLIQGRIQALESLANQGIATRFSRNMAYTLFANNLVDYEKKYRGMKSVVLNEFEAFADIELTTEKRGTWTIPPFFIDSVIHLAGFIMNCSDATDTQGLFCVTPGWNSMRFAKPLVAGGKYQSYVKMIPQADDPNYFMGDVYILQGDEIVGMTGGMKFHRYPRILLSRFFSAPDEGSAKKGAAPGGQSKPAVKSVQEAPKTPKPMEVQKSAPPQAQAQEPTPPQTPPPVKEEPPTDAAPALDSNSTAAKGLALIAKEAGLDPEDCGDEVSFGELGVDSLMSLVIAEKFREELGVQVGGSLFLEYPTVGDLKNWMLEYYS